MKVAVVPALNEEKRIEEVLKGLRKYVDKIIVVDDGSRDKTSEVSSKYALVLRHVVNLGKGAALRTGCKKALEFKPKYIFFIDGDGQHDPREVPKFVKKLEEGYELVQGVRSYGKMPFLKRIGNLMINFLFKALFGLNVRDTQCGFKAFRAEVYPKIRWSSNDYFVETEILAKAGMSGLKYAEVPIKTIYKERYKGITALDGLKICTKILALRLFG
ncbi:MAG TPA: glycosyltransferase family 2 protein [Candidatus Aenigmarchaeota archaeon]|nr:glycosyltransferase family 2 protein [Candidatus Aenigmarchaeota archaeon]